MNLLFVLENYPPHIGGVEIVFQNLCEGLASRGHSVTVVTRSLPGTRRRERKNGVRVLRVPSLDSRYVFTLAAIPSSVREAGRADVVLTTTYNGAFPAWLAAALRGKPAVITVHETWLGRWKELSNFSPIAAALHETLEWLVYRCTSFDRYVCVSHATKNDLASALPGKQIVTIHNGFDPATWKRQQDTRQLRKKLGLEGKYVLFASGRPGTTKGFEYLVRAFPRIKRAIPDAVLLLMLSTDAQYRHKIAEFREEAEDGVVFLESVPYKELSAYRRMADCIVVPSVSEGFGYAVLESVATGTPVVASSAGSIPEVIYGKHVLVRPKSPTAIADGVLRVRKGAYKKTKEKRFPWKDAISSYEKLAQSLLSRRRTR